MGHLNTPPSIDPFPPWLSFLELSIEFSDPFPIEYLCFIPPSCLDDHHQGAILAHETTHDESLRL